jgi:hypothetical protein
MSHEFPAPTASCHAKQNALGKLQPVISHSPVEGSPACVFHIQVLQDFMTIDEIAHKLFDEIDNFKPMPRGWFSWVVRLWPWRWSRRRAGLDLAKSLHAAAKPPGLDKASGPYARMRRTRRRGVHMLDLLDWNRC